MDALTFVSMKPLAFSNICKHETTETFNFESVKPLDSFKISKHETTR